MAEKVSLKTLNERLSELEDVVKRLVPIVESLEQMMNDREKEGNCEESERRS